MREINLSQNNTTQVDDDDFEQVSQHRWCVQEVDGHLYAVSTIHEERVYLHRFLMGITDGKRVKHLDGNTLNNQRANLATTANPFLGVSYVPKGKRHWRASLRFDGKQKHLGVFLTAEEAAMTRDEAAVGIWGKHATLNFPEDRA